MKLKELIFITINESNIYNLDCKSISDIIYNYTVPTKLEDTWDKFKLYNRSKEIAQYLTYYIWALNKDVAECHYSWLMQTFIIEYVNPVEELRFAFIYECKYSLMHYRDIFIPSLIKYYEPKLYLNRLHYNANKIEWLIYLIYNESLCNRGNVIPIFQGDLRLTMKEEKLISPYIEKYNVPL